MSDDPAAVAKRLTQAQKKALMTGYASNWPNLNAMQDSGLAYKGGFGGMSLTLTAAGAAVRAIVAQEAKDG